MDKERKMNKQIITEGNHIASEIITTNEVYGYK